MIDSRSKILLKAIVEKYISDAEPIGSRSLSKISGLELSPASIRNIMADLKNQGTSRAFTLHQVEFLPIKVTGCLWIV